MPDRATAGDDLPEIDASGIAEGGAGDDGSGVYRYSERATIVLPSGWARESEVIEFIDGPNSFKLRLGKQTHRHGDFDRLHFEVME